MNDLPTNFVPTEHQPIQTDIKLCAGLFVKHMVFSAGTYIPQHSHEHAHLSTIATGSVRIWRDGVLMGDLKAPAGIVIPAHSKHTFLALEPFTTVLCIHRVGADGEPEIYEEHHLLETH